MPRLRATPAALLLTTLVITSSPAAFAQGDPLDDARAAVTSFKSELPNFLVHRVTTRFKRTTGEHDWVSFDVVTSDVTVVNGKEDYRNVLVNGHPATGSIEKTGAWSTGEFALTLQNVLNPSPGAVFTKSGSGTVAGRTAWTYKVSAPQKDSQWIIVDNNGAKYRTAYVGKIWIDEETHRVLRIEQSATNIRGEFPYKSAETLLEYGFVHVGTKDYLLPVTSENSACLAVRGICARNETLFRDYRKFTSESEIKFDKPPNQ